MLVLEKDPCGGEKAPCSSENEPSEEGEDHMAGPRARHLGHECDVEHFGVWWLLVCGGCWLSGFGVGFVGEREYSGER